MKYANLQPHEGDPLTKLSTSFHHNNNETNLLKFLNLIFLPWLLSREIFAIFSVLDAFKFSK